MAFVSRAFGGVQQHMPRGFNGVYMDKAIVVISFEGKCSDIATTEKMLLLTLKESIKILILIIAE